MNKCKFKPYQHIVAVAHGFGITKDNMYAVIETYTNASDIPCVKCIGDDGNVVYNYQTVFREAKMPPCLEQDVVAWEDAVMVVEKVIDDCFAVKGYEKYFVGSEFITKIQHDKELQKALLVLIGENK